MLMVHDMMAVIKYKRVFYCEGAGVYQGERDRLNPLQRPSIGTLVTLVWKGARTCHSCGA